MGDLTIYAEARAAHDPEFAEGLESEYADFRASVLPAQILEGKKDAPRLRPPFQEIPE